MSKVWIVPIGVLACLATVILSLGTADAQTGMETRTYTLTYTTKTIEGKSVRIPDVSELDALSPRNCPGCSLSVKQSAGTVIVMAPKENLDAMARPTAAPR